MKTCILMAYLLAYGYCENLTRKQNTDTFTLGFLTNFDMGGRGPEVDHCDEGLWNIDYEISGTGGFLNAFRTKNATDIAIGLVVL